MSQEKRTVKIPRKTPKSAVKSAVKSGSPNHVVAATFSSRVPETALYVFKPMTERAKNRLAYILSRKNKTSFEDALAEINQKEANRRKRIIVPATGEHAGKQMIRKPVPFHTENQIRKTRITKKKKTAAQILAQEERRRKAERGLELRKAGVSYSEIAKAVGFGSPSHAKQQIDGLLTRHSFETAKDVILLDLQRLDEYQMRCTERLRNSNDLNQIDRLMRIMEMRYKIAGVGVDTAHELQQHFGINVQAKGVMVIQGSEQEFVAAMMQAVGIDPNSQDAQKYVEQAIGREPRKAPVKQIESAQAYESSTRLGDEEIIDAEIIESLDNPYPTILGRVETSSNLDI